MSILLLTNFILISQLLTVFCTNVVIVENWHVFPPHNMHTKGFDNLSREILDSKFVLEINDNCDYEEDTRGYTWNEEDFLVLNINIRGLYSKQTNLKNLIDEIGLRGEPPTVITVSETWLTQHSPVPEIPGYKIYRRDRLHKKGGGVAIFVSNRLQSREVTISNLTPTSFEHCAVEVKGRNEPVIICSIYRPTNTITKTFLVEYNKLMKQFKKISSEIIVGLDHNMDFLRSENIRTRMNSLR